MDRQPSGSPSLSYTVALWVIVAILGAGVWAGIVELRGIESRLETLQGSAEGGATRQESLGSELGEISRDLRSIEKGIDRVREEAAYARALAERMDRTEGEIGAIGMAVEAQAGSLKSLEEVQASFGPQTLEVELAERDARLLRRWEALSELVADARSRAEKSNRLVEALEEEMRAPRNLRRMWMDLVGPVVQLAGETSVGSGVLLQSRLEAESDTYHTYMITAWHVVRDIQGDLSKTDMPVPVTIYAENGTIDTVDASLVCFNAELDAALLELVTEEAMENGARIPRRETLDSVRIFDEVYAVGCPLGNDPIPTRGEIATSRHYVDDERYWMINAPTYIGNSGGGIFHSETHELLGIFSKIYTHGTVRPTIVPHMGLVTPLNAIYDWLAVEGYDIVEPSAEAGDVHIALVGR